MKVMTTKLVMRDATTVKPKGFSWKKGCNDGSWARACLKKAKDVNCEAEPH